MTSAPKFIIAADCDDVLVNTAGKWVRSILSDQSLASEIPKEAIDAAARAHPMNREKFDISSHFSPGDWMTKELHQRMLDAYFHDSEFYDDLHPSSYCRALKQMAQMGTVEAIWVVTSCVDIRLPVTRSKARFLDRVFDEIRSHTTVKYIFTQQGETKAEAINSMEIKYNSFVDDSVANIVDVIKNTESRGKEFLIPRYRYNLQVPDMPTLVGQHRANIVWFDNDMILEQDRLVDRLHDHSEFDKFKLNWN